MTKLMILLSLSGCGIPELKQAPIKVWSGDHEVRAMYRKQNSNDMIECANPKFSEMVCLMTDDFKRIVIKLNACK